MESHKIVLNPGYTNCYILEGENNEAVIIDPGANYKKISRFLKDKNLKPVAVLLTHGHFDHHGAAALLQKDGCIIYMNQDDEDILDYIFGKWQKQFAPDRYVTDGDTLIISGIKIKVIGTPGHSKGGVCYHIGNNLYSGDTLFHSVIGFYHLKGGSREALHNSLRKLYTTLPNDTVVFPGHGKQTTIGREKRFNRDFRMV